MISKFGGGENPDYWWSFRGLSSVVRAPMLQTHCFVEHSVDSGSRFVQYTEDDLHWLMTIRGKVATRWVDELYDVRDENGRLVCYLFGFEPKSDASQIHVVYGSNVCFCLTVTSYSCAGLRFRCLQCRNADVTKLRAVRSRKIVPVFVDWLKEFGQRIEDYRNHGPLYLSPDVPSSPKWHEVAYAST